MSRPIPTDDTTRIALSGGPFDALFPATFSGREALSTLSEISLRAIGAAPPVALSGLTGQHATLSLEWSSTPRLLDALCTRVSQLPSTVDGSHYALELRPWLWLLTLAANNRIFQGKTTQQIGEAVFSGHRPRECSFNLTVPNETREYCVQYAESHFAFATRLCEEEGWFYFSAHSAGTHTL